MRTEIAEYAGFCFGVSRAMKLVYETVEKSEKNICMVGPVIHNPDIIEDLKSKGVRVASDVSEVKKEETAIIRAHGITKEEQEKLSEFGIYFVDTTCPFVKKIHKIVSKAEKEQKSVIIIGDPTHPEVIGIKSYNKNSYVFKDHEDFEKWTENNPELSDKPFEMVAQTTLNLEIWKKCCKYAEKVYTNCKINDTICSATEERQKAALKLSKSCDAMIVIGGRTSSNTNKLYQICKKYCENTFHIENVSELDKNIFKKFNYVGITAGASTPDGIIKEVTNTMAEINNAEEFNFEEALEKTLKPLTNGDKVKGIVVNITPTDVYVDLGQKYAGFIPRDQVSADPNAKVDEVVKIGDEVEVVVLRVNDVEGTVMLSKKKIDAHKGWEKIVSIYENKEIVEGTVAEVTKGGLVVLVQGTRVFVPNSQASLSRNADLQTLNKKTVSLRIIEVQDGRRRRVIGSIRSVLAEQKKELTDKFWSEIELGQKFTGVVKSIVSYGAFVDLGGVDGMVHISELSWQKIKNPSEVVKEGQSIEVYVKDLDKEKRKVSLGFKKAEDNPWEIFKAKFALEDEVEAKIINFMPFGAFAEIIPGVDGLIHISQIANKRINAPADVLKIGEIVKAKITDIDLEKNKVSLSIKALLEAEPEVEEVNVEGVTIEKAEETSAEEAPAEATEE